MTNKNQLTLNLLQEETTQTLRSTVMVDDMVKKVSAAFDYEFTGESSFVVPKLVTPKEYQIGLIVGPSGSGKSSILKNIGCPITPKWERDKAICSHFDSIDKLHAVGLNSIPTLCKPYHVCSNGEQHRADMARQLKDGAVIDEFTSVVDRSVAKSLSHAIHRYIRQMGLQKVTFATCHYDVVDWLCPDWIFDTSTGELTRGLLRQRPAITLEIMPATRKLWSAFAPHHYLSDKINNTAKCWAAIWNDVIVGFASTLTYPSGTVKNAYREHRTVVLPDYQGLGIGVRLSDAVAEIHIRQGKRYFSKTANPRMGGYRDNSLLWRPTSKNKKKRDDYVSRSTQNNNDKFSAKLLLSHASRECWSHEYVGLQNGKESVGVQK